MRTRPQDAAARWLLFELLCVLGHWERALKQLQMRASLSKDFGGTAHVMQGLIRAERQRMDAFAGMRPPSTLDEADAAPPPWLAGLAQALSYSGSNDTPEAMDAIAVLRGNALQIAPETAGATNLQPSFQWITDSDTRLGPVCEVMLQGAYRWLPFAAMASIDKEAPSCLLDLVWSPVDITLHTGTVLQGYMPMRYPVQPGERDALLMARETVWQETGTTGIFARGQKMWTTDVGDMALLDLRHGIFRNDDALQADAGDQADAAR